MVDSTYKEFMFHDVKNLFTSMGFASQFDYNKEREKKKRP